MPNIIGIVKEVFGTVFAKDSAGNLRELKVGDKIYAGEAIVGVATVEAVNNETVTVDPKFEGDATAIDFNTVLEDEAPAAGLLDGEGGGDSFVVVDRIDETVPTNEYAFLINPTGTAPTLYAQTDVPVVDEPVVVDDPVVEEPVVPPVVDEPVAEPPVVVDEPVVNEPVVEINPNNGFGNGDQDAPGNSGSNNNAENALNLDEVVEWKVQKAMSGEELIFIGFDSNDILKPTGNLDYIGFEEILNDTVVSFGYKSGKVIETLEITLSSFIGFTETQVIQDTQII